jgi:hypothetical protein
MAVLDELACRIAEILKQSVHRSLLAGKICGDVLTGIAL